MKQWWWSKQKPEPYELSVIALCQILLNPQFSINPMLRYARHGLI